MKKFRFKWQTPVYHTDYCYECEGGWNFRWPLRFWRVRPPTMADSEGVFSKAALMHMPTTLTAGTVINYGRVIATAINDEADGYD